MKTQSEDPVVVVGAGPVGLTMAVELARHGTRCRILDQSAAPAAGTRALAVQARTLEIFDAMGVIDPVLAAGHRIHGANIFAEGRRILHFSFDELASPYPFAVDLPQSETERFLIDRLRALGVEVEWSTAVTGVQQDSAGATLYLNQDGRIGELRASYVMGCDGGNSTVRHVSSIPFDGPSAEEHFLLAEARVDWGAADDEWSFWFHDEGLFCLFPLRDGYCRAIADIPRDTPASVEQWKAVVERRGPPHARLGESRWISSYRITRRHVTNYRQGRVFLAGDAAHVQSPAGSQGMNTGIQDAYNLAWKLAMVLRGNAPDALLDSYAAERQPVARSVATMTGHLSSIAAFRHPVSQGVRNRLIPILAGFEVLEHRLVNRLAEISVNYRRSPAVGQFGRWYAAGPLPGDRAPDAPLSGGRRIAQLLKDTRHVLILFAAEHPDEEDQRGFENLARYMRDGYGGEVVTYLIVLAALAWEGEQIADADGAAHHAYAAGVPCMYLIRPDGYVGFRGLSGDPLPLLEYLNRVYEPPMEEIGEQSLSADR